MRCMCIHITPHLPAADKAMAVVLHALSKVEVKATSNFIPLDPMRMPASAASISPFLVRGMSHLNQHNRNEHV